MQNINHITFLFTFCLFNKENEQTKQKIVKFIKKSLIYLLGDKTAKHVTVMQHMLISYLSSLTPLVSNLYIPCLNLMYPSKHSSTLTHSDTLKYLGQKAGWLDTFTLHKVYFILVIFISESFTDDNLTIHGKPDYRYFNRTPISLSLSLSLSLGLAFEIELHNYLHL